jgi:hypothetical protein
MGIPRNPERPSLQITSNHQIDPDSQPINAGSTYELVLWIAWIARLNFCGTLGLGKLVVNHWLSLACFNHC